MAPNRLALLSAAAVAISGCADDAGTGTLAITAYGEEFIEEGIPADKLSDGWAIAYDKFEVTLSAIATRSAKPTGPVSRPSSIFITITPVSLSPAMIARWMFVAVSFQVPNVPEATFISTLSVEAPNQAYSQS